MTTIDPEEIARRAAVERYRRSGALFGEKLERVVKLASTIFGFAHVNLTTHHDEMQVCHVHVGRYGQDRRREETFCRYPVASHELMVVHDLSKDARFTDHPVVAGKPHLRFYAGAPLVTPCGHAIGALCLLDTRPRKFSARDGELLADLAALAVEHMELVSVVDEAKYDPLTGLRNRGFLVETIKASLEADRASSVLLIDLDGFKQINDSLGHGCGDEALALVAGRLREFARDDRTIARLGGDEFVVFVDGTADPIEVTRLAEAVVARLGEAITLQGHVVNFGASVGVVLRSYETEAMQLVGNADLAMYRAKQDGRNCHRLFTRSMRNVARDRGDVVLEMQDAWEDGAFQLYYQPIVRLADGRWTGAEALLRWNYPYRGVLSPALFLPVLEKSHLAVDLGAWVIDEACRQAALWRGRFDPEFSIAVNLFELQFRPGTLVMRVREALSRHRLPPQALRLEMTERIFLGDDPKIFAQVRQLREMGVGIAFDDFGTGFASLSALRSYPVSCIKIDRSFIADMIRKPDDLTIVTALISLAKKLNLDVVAEGIETEEQRAVVAREAGIEGQGFLFSKPEPADVIERIWHRPQGLALRSA
ncbi:sensor domain-containing phosphodiesterase [Jiella sonneratiae]|uniref:Sensor domain-containing phosphodiesterase n=1 Tax=Jiella sonneratiae TaxID=2816856 RepID=A0ABS3J0V8_9HYPH|nr:sensor domain-containing phosphodiesterase [Jiella sonneratiae]MBO0903302.1 sensor domain-containing phosphodiesterase [Jiella sonneratiae]